MRIITKPGLLCLCMTLLSWLPQSAHAGLIGRALSASPDLGLLNYNNPLAGAFSSSADGFQRYERGTGAVIPAALLDDGGSDTLGIITASDNAPFFGVVDTLNADNAATAVARWVFDVAGFRSLQLAVGMAAMGDFERSDGFRWQYRFDAGPLLDLFESATDESATQTYVLSDRTLSLADPLTVDGVPLDNRLRNFQSGLTGGGSRLTVELSADFNGGTEVAAFRSLLVSGAAVAAVSSPGTAALFVAAFGALLTFSRGRVSRAAW